MVLTQESVLAALVAQGGAVKKSALVEQFKGLLDCVDPAQRARDRELFKTFVNNVAFVRDVDGVRWVVVKRMYQHLVARGGNGETGERRREEAQRLGGAAEPHPDLTGERGQGSSELALPGSGYAHVRVRRKMDFEVLGPGRAEPGAVQSKPYALPLRAPPGATRVEVHKLKVDPRQLPHTGGTAEPEAPSVQTDAGARSPQPRSDKAPQEPKDLRTSPTVPLELLEHEWLVKCASGLWSQAYGLLLRDNQLAEKKDFISGFTVLHWAAKCGNAEMLVKVVDMSRQGGVDLDVNARARGGYTPLHIAALHNQEYVMAMLVGEYGADVSVRDNGGKKACHYLHTGSSETLRGMLGGRTGGRRLEGGDEPDHVPVPDLSKGRHSISRLLQPHVTGYKKKEKQRPGFHSVTYDPNEESEGKGRGLRHRIMSDAFM